MTDENTSQITNTHYSGGFQYTEDHLDFFPHAEGYVNVIDYSAFHYVYTYKDHLGNIRLKYTLDPDTNETAILEENHYYPFGLTHQGYNADHKFFFVAIDEVIELVEVTSIMDDKYKYKFNGMEWQNELDLNHYDFGARNYDPALGRWMNVDALSDLYPDWSPYNYTLNNPVFYIDPDGNYVDVSFIYKKDDNDEYKNPNLVEAFEFFASTDFGKSFLSNYAEKGQAIAGHEYKKDGKFHKKGVDLHFGDLDDSNTTTEATTSSEEFEGGLRLTINIRSGKQADEYIEEIGHEGWIHADKFAVDYSDNRKLDYSMGVDKDLVNYVQSQASNQHSRFIHHFQERRDKLLNTKLVPILTEFYRKKGHKNVQEKVKRIIDFAN